MFLFCFGELDDKLQFLFSMYDRDGNGYITKEELKEYIKGCSRACQNLDFLCNNLNIGSSVPEKIVKLSVDKVFEQLDMDDDGRISFQEFKSFAIDDPTIQMFLETMNQTVPLVSKALPDSQQTKPVKRNLKNSYPQSDIKMMDDGGPKTLQVPQTRSRAASVDDTYLHSEKKPVGRSGKREKIGLDVSHLETTTHRDW